MLATRPVLLSLFFGVSALTWAASAEEGQAQESSKPVYFSHCGVVNIQSGDGTQLTREEQIALAEKSLYEALDENRQCTQKAMTSGKKSIAEAGGVASLGNKGHNGAGQASNSTVKAGETSDAAQPLVMANSGAGVAHGSVSQNEITVCQISRENLSVATNPEDKSFWQTEVDKHCK